MRGYVGESSSYFHDVTHRWQIAEDIPRACREIVTKISWSAGRKSGSHGV